MSNPERDNRKQAVSIRMNRSDVRTIKRLAERLGARDSDVIRFAIKLMLSKLSLLQDPSVRGRSLVPLFLEAGPELMGYFEIDYARLASILNDGVEADHSVDPDDIQLLVMHGLQRSYLKLRMAGLRRTQGPETQRSGKVAASQGADEPVIDESLRQYLYGKYLYADQSEPLPLASSMGGGS